jgi:hypothetical protein
MGRTVEDILAESGIGVDDSLEHYGVPGMKWGKRRKAKKEAIAKAAAEKEAVKNMSDDELKKKINRIKLEREYAKLTEPQINAGRKVVGELLMEVGKAKVKSYMMNDMGDDIKGILKSQVKAAVTPAPQRQVMQFAKRPGF